MPLDSAHVGVEFADDNAMADERYSMTARRSAPQ